MESTPIQVREKALFSYIIDFVAALRKIEDIEIIIDEKEAAENICQLYYRYTEEVIRPTVKSKVIQNYKIIGFTEFCVLRVQPISLAHQNDPLEAAQLNARLALHICLCLLMDWNLVDTDKFRKLLETDHEIKNFLNEHYVWLACLDSKYYFAGFSNSQVWRLFHFLVRDRIKNL